jgi:hypothetical protein
MRPEGFLAEAPGRGFGLSPARLVRPPGVGGLDARDEAARGGDRAGDCGGGGGRDLNHACGVSAWLVTGPVVLIIPLNGRYRLNAEPLPNSNTANLNREKWFPLAVRAEHSALV